MMRNTSASANPICRARFASCGSQRETSTEMNTMLSTPSTTSSAVSVASAAQAWGSVRRSSIVLGSSQESRPQEVERDGTQSCGDPWVGRHVAGYGDHRQSRPCDKKRNVQRAQTPHPERMEKWNRHECENGKQHDQRRRNPWTGAQQKQIKHRRVPHGRKAAEMIAIDLHATVREIQRATEDDHDCERHRDV